MYQEPFPGNKQLVGVTLVLVFFPVFVLLFIALICLSQSSASIPAKVSKLVNESVSSEV